MCSLSRIRKIQTSPAKFSGRCSRGREFFHLVAGRLGHLVDGSKKAELRLALEVALLAHRTVVFPDGRVKLDTTPLPSCEFVGLVTST